MRNPMKTIDRWREFSHQHSMPGRQKYLRLADATIFRNLRILKLRLANAFSPIVSGVVTIIIPMRNRADQRLANLLRSIRNQTLPSERIEILISDFGSEIKTQKSLAELAAQYQARICRSGTIAEEWSRGKAINRALSEVSTAYSCTADADLFFSPNFFELALHRIEIDPLVAVAGAMLDLPPDCGDLLNHFDFDRLRALATKRNDRELHPSCLTLRTEWLKRVGGYDESYRIWGFEDDDLWQRLVVMGLHSDSPFANAAYFHQWHPKYEGVNRPELQMVIDENKKTFQRAKSVFARKSSLKRKQEQ